MSAYVGKADIYAHFLELEPGVHGRAVVRITADGLAALLSSGKCQGRDELVLTVIGQGQRNEDTRATAQ